MSTLHTISKSPKSQLLSECLMLASDGDGILFIEDGVYYCANNESLENLTAEITCFSLKEDLDARGLKLNDSDSVSLVNYRKFVALCENYDKVVSWF
jgi:sulfur relay protein TusB/DsrH